MVTGNRRRSVAITGIGIVAPNGIGRGIYWDNLLRGRSAVRHIASSDASPYPCKIAAEVSDFRPSDFISRRRGKNIARFSEFAVAATRLAIADAKLTLSPALAAHTLVCFGSSGGADVFHTAVEDLRAGGVPAVSPWAALEYPPHALSCHVSIEFGVTGRALSVSSNCSTASMQSPSSR